MEARQHLMQTAVCGVGGGEKIGSSKVQVFIVVAGTELDTVTVLPPVRAITNHVHFIYIIVHMMWYVVYIHIHYHHVQKIRNLSITGYRAIVVRYQRTTDVCGTAGTPVLVF